MKSNRQVLNEDEQQQQFQALEDKWNEYFIINNQAIKLSSSEDSKLALEVSNNGITAFDSMQIDLEVLVQHSLQPG